MAFDTVANIVSDCAVECGLGSVSDVFASTDENIVLMRALLKSEGQRLVKEHQWLACEKEHTFSTSAASSYNLPSDFDGMIDGTGWNRSLSLPLHPISAEQWQQLQATAATSPSAILFRPKSLTLSIYPTTDTGSSIAFEYLSSYWVRATASSAPDKDAPTVNTDVVHIDRLLVVKALKAAFLRNRGFDTSAAQAEYDEALSAARGRGANAAPTLQNTPGAGSGVQPAISAAGALYI